MKLEDAAYRDDVYQDVVDRWTCPADAMRSLVCAAAGLFESYRGGPFGVCQRTVRDVERELFFYAHAAKVRFMGDTLEKKP